MQHKLDVKLCDDAVEKTTSIEILEMYQGDDMLIPVRKLPFEIHAGDCRTCIEDCCTGGYTIMRRSRALRWKPQCHTLLEKRAEETKIWNNLNADDWTIPGESLKIASDEEDYMVPEEFKDVLLPYGWYTQNQADSIDLAVYSIVLAACTILKHISVSTSKMQTMSMRHR